MHIHHPIMLASASPSRRAMLKNAGLIVDAVAARIDEASVRDSIEAAVNTPEDLAIALANAKAANVAAQYPDHVVIGADQLLICNGRRLDKATDLKEAHRHLKELQGRRHDLISAVALHRGDHILWSTTETARMTMRPLTDDQIATYLASVGEDVLSSVGCYHLEGRGAWLFEQVDGDFFTVLGLPLLALFESLRRLGMVS